MKTIAQLVAEGNEKEFYRNSTYGWPELRIRILERDNYECQMCRGHWSDGEHLPKKYGLKRASTIHHIQALKNCPELAKDEDNLVSLCSSCHNIVEGRGKWFENDWTPKKEISEEKW